MADRLNHRRPSDLNDPIPKKRQLVENCDLEEDLSSDDDFKCSGEQDDMTWQPNESESDLEEFEYDISQNNVEIFKNFEINDASTSNSSSEGGIAQMSMNDVTQINDAMHQPVQTKK